MNEVKFTIEMGWLMLFNHLGSILLDISFSRTILIDLIIVVLVYSCIMIKRKWIIKKMNALDAEGEK